MAPKMPSTALKFVTVIPTRTQTLDALARRAAQADAEAAAQLYERLKCGLLQFFSRRGGRTDLAEELAQATWAETWRALRNGRYDPDRAAFTTFVFAIGHKLWLRRGRGVIAPISSLDREPDFGAASEAPPEEALHLAELIGALRACLETVGLTREERRVVDESCGGATEREIAAKLNLAPSTVNVRKRLAYGRIRWCLQQKGYGDAEQRPLGAE